MKHFKILTSKKAKTLVQKREGETKFFEDVSFGDSKTSIDNQLEKSSAKFVLFGISEDIGVRANFGKPGTKNAWNSVLKTILNIQSNRFTNANHLLILGHFDFDKIDFKMSDDKIEKKLRKKVNTIDNEVTHLVHLVKKNGKIPIAIGGGHNNAYGLIKGCALALKSKVNTINFDAHTDFRALEGIESLGITAGASAPEILINEVVESFKKRYLVRLETVETAVENVNFKVPRVLRETV